MKVRALALGYYGHKRRREGEVFNLVDMELAIQDERGKVVGKRHLPAAEQFSPAWMEKVEGKGSKKPKSKTEDIEQEGNSDDSEVI